ncbi:hypothetical protein EMIT0P291_40027 [Pseudomonas sp. IT-P291]
MHLNTSILPPLFYKYLSPRRNLPSGSHSRLPATSVPAHKAITERCQSKLPIKASAHRSYK